MFLSCFLLGDFPPPFDQLQKRLAAVLQAMTFLEIVEIIHRLAGKMQGQLLVPGLDLALPVGTNAGGNGRFGRSGGHGDSRRGYEKPTLRLNLVAVHERTSMSRVYPAKSHGFP